MLRPATQAQEVPLEGPGLDRAVLGLESLIEARHCRRLPWWRQLGYPTKGQEEELPELPQPWPNLPPGWRGSGRGWARAFLEAPPAWGLGGRVDWILEQEGRPHLVMLGVPTPTLRLRAGLLQTILMARGNPRPKVWVQRCPRQGLSGTWLGEWPTVAPLGLRPLEPLDLQRALDQLHRDLDHPCPPPQKAPRSRCWDCPASRLCAEHV